MPKHIYYVASSLDGYIATDDDSLDWLLSFGFEPFRAHYERFLAGVGAIVMGASTYEWIRREEPGQWAYESIPCWVLTHRPLDPPPNGQVRFAAGDVRAVAADADRAAAGRNVWVLGGGNIAAQFQAADLLDELRITYMPVALGSGRRLLPVAAPTDRFLLSATTAFDGGGIELRYTRRERSRPGPA